MPNHPHSMIINEYEAADIAQQMDPRTVASMVGAGGLSLASAPLGHSASVAPTHKPPTKCGTCCRFLRKVISFLLSHIGLLSLVVGYCIMGAFVFEILERENELMVKRNMTKNRLSVTDDLWAITKKMEVLKRDEWTANVTTELRSFEMSLIKALKQDGWDGSESEDTVTWSFSGGLFYSITVITTIGYGHIAPKTPVAKIVTIFYAILGIPLTVLCWSNIGDAMANSFRFCYWRICCYVCTKKPKKRKRRSTSRGRGVPGRHSRARSIRRSHRTSRSADTISDSLNSYSISDPDRFFDDGGTVVDIQSFNTQAGSDGVPVSTSSGGRSIFTRNRPSKRSLPRSASQGPLLQGQATSPNVVVNNQLAAQLNSSSTQQETPATENNDISYTNQQSNKENNGAVPETANQNDSNTSPELSNDFKETSYLSIQNEVTQQNLSENDPQNSNQSPNDKKNSDDNPTSNATSTKKETKKENKKLSTFSVAKVGMKLKEKAQKTQKKSVSANATAKDQMTSTKNGIEKQNNETTTSTNIGTSEVQNNGSPSATGASVPSPTIKTPPTTITSGQAMQTPNRGNRPFLNLSANPSSPTTQLSASPSSPIVSPLVSGMTPSVHQQQHMGMPPQFGGNIGLQQPPTLRLERARPHEENEWLEDPYYYEEYISEEEEEGEDYSTKNVPIWLSILLVLIYIGFGAYIFREWEKWSWLDSSYFCFITLTTIGFGDMVPDQKDTDGEVRIALTSLYLLFGIAMICMAFNLVQVQVINNVKNMGKQLGIIKDDRYDDDY